MPGHKGHLGNEMADFLCSYKNYTTYKSFHDQSNYGFQNKDFEKRRKERSERNKRYYQEVLIINIFF